MSNHPKDFRKHNAKSVLVEQKLSDFAARATEIAQAWRATQPEPRRSSGVVLVFEGKVYGWKNELRDPQHDQPGAIAVDPDGRAWVAEGGNDYDGAERWVGA